MAEEVAAPGEAAHPLVAPSVSGRTLGKGSRSMTRGTTIQQRTAGSIIPRLDAARPPPVGSRTAPQNTRRDGPPSSPLAAWTIITTRGLVSGSLGLYPPAVIRDSNNGPIRGWPALRSHRLKVAGASPRPRRRRSCNSPRGAHKSLCSHLPVTVARVGVRLTPPPALGKLTPLLRSTRALLARSNASPHS